MLERFKSNALGSYILLPQVGLSSITGLPVLIERIPSLLTRNSLAMPIADVNYCSTSYSAACSAASSFLIPVTRVSFPLIDLSSPV